MRRDEVGGLVQQFWAAWAVVSSSSRRRRGLARCLRLASKAEKYQLDSCRGRSADEEAGILATEASAIYDFLTEVAPTARPSDQVRARCDAVLHVVRC
jgi:hypothetical protein